MDEIIEERMASCLDGGWNSTPCHAIASQQKQCHFSSSISVIEHNDRTQEETGYRDYPNLLKMFQTKDFL